MINSSLMLTFTLDVTELDLLVQSQTSMTTKCSKGLRIHWSIWGPSKRNWGVPFNSKCIHLMSSIVESRIVVLYYLLCHKLVMPAKCCFDGSSFMVVQSGGKAHLIDPRLYFRCCFYETLALVVQTGG